MASIIFALCEEKYNGNFRYFQTMEEGYTKEEDAIARLDSLHSQYQKEGRKFFVKPIEVDKYVPMPFMVTFDTRALTWRSVPTDAEKESDGYPEREEIPFWVWPCIHAMTRQDAIRKAKEFAAKLMERG